MDDENLNFDNNGDVPRPDGYSPNELSDWLSPTVFQTSSEGIKGYSGISPLAARSDHVHPCNIDPRKPEKIGVPSFLSSSEEVVIPAGSLPQSYSYSSVGKIGIPKGDNRLSNMYALSNHVHEYGFIEEVSHYESNKFNKLYNTVPDGRFAPYGLNFYSAGNIGHAKALLDDELLSTDDAEVFGYIGRIPYPAKFDHSHPLNVRDLHESNSTGNNVKYNIKPIDFDPTKSTSGYGASYGTDTFYARTDHVHPLPTGGTGATGVGSDNTMNSGIFDSAEMQNVVSPSNDPDTQSDAYYGNDKFNQTWKRDSTGNTNGFKINVVCSIGNQGYSNVMFFRTLTFDKYGLCREVSAVEKGVVLM